MASSVAVQPGVIDLGAVTPGVVQKFVILVAPTAASVTARIDGGGGRFRLENVVCQEVSVQQLSAEEIEQLPRQIRNDPRHHAGVVTRFVGSSDGIVPLAVQHQNEVIVNVEYRGEDVAGEGVHSATLAITGTGWDPISVPMSALVAQAAVAVPSTTQTVPQGGAAAVSFRSGPCLDRTLRSGSSWSSTRTWP